MNLEEALEQIVLLKEDILAKEDLIKNQDISINQFKEKEEEYNSTIKRLQEINHNMFTKIDSQFITKTKTDDEVIEQQEEESFTLSDLINII